MGGGVLGWFYGGAFCSKTKVSHIAHHSAIDGSPGVGTDLAIGYFSPEIPVSCL